MANKKSGRATIRDASGKVLQTVTVHAKGDVRGHKVKVRLVEVKSDG